MRQIKFRAWDPTFKKMYRSSFDCGVYYSIDTELLWMQFTGLFDRGGKEIYEGDIIQYGNYKGIVEFGIHDEWYAPCFWIKNLNDDYSGKNYKLQRYFKSQTCVEVIGNIYEHPHLMEAE